MTCPDGKESVPEIRRFLGSRTEVSGTHPFARADMPKQLCALRAENVWKGSLGCQWPQEAGGDLAE